jgi:hypothetical protein
VEKKVVDPLVFLTIYLGGCGEFQHSLERDWGFLAFLVAFSDETGPHGIVQFQ